MVRDASDDQKLKSLGQPGSQLRPLLAATADPVVARVVLKVADPDPVSRFMAISTSVAQDPVRHPIAVQG